jgi:hypothetical protein
MLNTEHSFPETSLAALQMILEQRKELREQGKNPDRPVITPKLQKAFNDL